MNRFRILAALGCSLAGAIVPAAAAAAALPDAYYTGGAGGQGPVYTGSSIHSFGNSVGGSADGVFIDGGGGASGSVTAANTQSVEATGAATNAGIVPGQYSGSGNGSALYYVGLTGPDAAIVPLTASGYLVTSAASNGGYATSQSLFSLYSPDGYTGGFGFDLMDQTATAQMLCGSAAFQSGCGRLDFNIGFNLTPGYHATLYLSAEAAASVGDYATMISGTAQAQAIADPVFAIDPTWLAAHPGYRLTFSTGVVNQAAVPESATWGMMLAGFGAVGHALRQRRRTSSVAA